jgi:hypothetical protein
LSCLSVLHSLRPSFRPHGTRRLQLHGFSWTFVFECFRKSVEKMKFLICVFFENLSGKFKFSFKSDKNNVRALYMKTDICTFWYLANFFFE